MRRNRKSVAATTLIFLALLASLGYAAWRQQQALREGQRALRMQTFMYRLFKLANSNFTGKPAATIPDFLRLGVKVLPEYIKDPVDLRAAQMGLAESMYENGDLDNAQKVFSQTITEAKSAGDAGSEAEAEAFSGNIAYLQGQTDQGQALTEHALELSRKPTVTPTVRVWSEIYYAANRENNGFRSDKNLQLLEAAVEESRERHLPERETAYAIYMLASDFEVRGRLDEAEQLIKEAIAIYGHEPYAICDQSEMYADLAYIRAARGQFEASLPLYQRAYDGYKTCSGPDNRGTLTVGDYMAGAMIRAGKAKEAIPMLEASMPAWRKVAGSSPDLANPLHFLALAYVDTGQYTQAEKAAEELVKVQEGKVAADDHRMGSSHLVWAKALAGEHRYQEALPHAEIADKVLAQTLISPTQKQASADAHHVLLDIQSNLEKK